MREKKNVVRIELDPRVVEMVSDLQRWSGHNPTALVNYAIRCFWHAVSDGDNGNGMLSPSMWIRMMQEHRKLNVEPVPKQAEELQP